MPKQIGLFREQLATSHLLRRTLGPHLFKPLAAAEGFLLVGAKTASVQGSTPSQGGHISCPPSRSCCSTFRQNSAASFRYDLTAGKSKWEALSLVSSNKLNSRERNRSESEGSSAFRASSMTWIAATQPEPLNGRNSRKDHEKHLKQGRAPRKCKTSQNNSFNTWWTKYWRLTRPEADLW